MTPYQSIIKRFENPCEHCGGEGQVEREYYEQEVGEVAYMTYCDCDLGEEKRLIDKYEDCGWNCMAKSEKERLIELGINPTIKAQVL